MSVADRGCELGRGNGDRHVHPGHRTARRFRRSGVCSSAGAGDAQKPRGADGGRVLPALGLRTRSSRRGGWSRGSSRPTSCGTPSLPTLPRMLPKRGCFTASSTTLSSWPRSSAGVPSTWSSSSCCWGALLSSGGRCGDRRFTRPTAQGRTRCSRVSSRSCRRELDGPAGGAGA